MLLSLFVAQHLHGACRQIKLQPADAMGLIQGIADGQVLHCGVYVVVAAVDVLVGVEHVAVASLRREYAIVGERFRRVEVEHKHKVAALERQHLVIVLVPKFLDRGRLEIAL